MCSWSLGSQQGIDFRVFSLYSGAVGICCTVEYIKRLWPHWNHNPSLADARTVAQPMHLYCTTTHTSADLPISGSIPLPLFEPTGPLDIRLSGGSRRPADSGGSTSQAPATGFSRIHGTAGALGLATPRHDCMLSTLNGAAPRPWMFPPIYERRPQLTHRRGQFVV